MKTSIVRKDFLKSDEFIELKRDTKTLYMYLLMCPNKGYLDVFKLEKQLAILITGLSSTEINYNLGRLEESGFIEVFNDYIGLIKKHTVDIGGQYGGINKERELASLPIDIREHFDLDDEFAKQKEAKKVPKKPGPAAETISDIIDKQPEELQQPLRDFVADRVERKKAPTTRAVKGWITKLESMYPNSPKNQATSINQSIERGWLGLFEVNNNDKTSENRKFL